MNKKQIRLTENDLKQMVKESVNKILSEAYGTPDEGTQNAINNIRNLEVGNNDYNSLNSIYKQLLNTRNSVDEWTTSVETMDSDGNRSYNRNISRKYSEYLVKQIDAAIRTCKILMGKRVMNQGEQPDENYFNR